LNCSDFSAYVIVTAEPSYRGLATLYAEIGGQLLRDRAADALTGLVHTALDRVPGAEWVSVSRGRAGSFETAAATDAAARAVDDLQYRLGSGPCVDAILCDASFQTGDLRNDPRWPEFGRLAADRVGVASMQAFRLFIENDDEIAALNFYSLRPAAFDTESLVVGTLLATHGALAIAASAARERADQLQRALTTNREIAMAMGILIERYKLTPDQSFDLLRVASQNTNRKLVDIAVDLVETGELNLPVRTAGRRS
jgi:hypothetical protein